MTTKLAAVQRDPMDVLGLAILNTVTAILVGVLVVARWMVLFPMFSLPLGIAVAAGTLLAWWAGVGVAGCSAAGIMLWRRRRPEMFERWVTSRARHRALAWWRYRRRWTRLLSACHLTISGQDRVLVPRLLSVELGTGSDRVRVRMLPGQCPADWENRTDHLAHAFGAAACRATITGPALVELAFRHGDSLVTPVPLRHIAGGLSWEKAV
ncbi:hypothetical protein [Nocardia puris]|uniref:S-DNA-T family DNA segregation ATPase FtsK/SpoIIIE n=1 Tax=Nocardia puris TaxID=208602 RepID=A0A366E6F2_9NOCA|nr:hypothetical protein [Nocardia puris]RBO97074.1 hypothetical protein DFR74_1011094 [Nocardia puris]